MIAGTGTAGAPPWLSTRRAAWLVAAMLGAAALAMLLMLLVPGRTVATQHIWDLMIFVDGADRIRMGQVPNIDFHSPIGPLTYALLAGGLGWSGSLGGMMPATTALILAVLLPLLLYTSLSRLAPGLALAFGLYILLLCASPFFIGEIRPNPTWGMFYNRFGWALSSLLFLQALPRRSGWGPDWLDSAVMAALWLLLFYTKITYAVVALPVIGLMVLLPASRRRALLAIGMIAGAALIVELLWRGTLPYLADVRMAASATGTVRSGLLGLFATVANNALGIYVVGAVLLLAAIDRIRYEYLLLSLLMVAAGILLDRHNSQGPGILSFVPAALVAILAPRREGETARSHALAALLLAGTLMVPIAVAAAGSLGFHALTALRNPQPASGSGGLAGIVTPAPPTSTPNQPMALAAAQTAATGCEAVPRTGLNIDATPGERGVGAEQSLAILADGERLLRREPRLAGSTFVLDLSNPYNALLGRPGPIGAEPFIDAEVNASKAVHRAPEALLGDADVIMVPRLAQKYATFDLLRRLYRPYIAAHFAPVAWSSCWDAYGRVAR